MESIKQGDVSEATNFMGPVIARPAFDKITGIITKAKEAGGEVLSGGTCALGCASRPFGRRQCWRLSVRRSRRTDWCEGDDSKGYFIKPTLLLTKDPSVAVSSSRTDHAATRSR